jgi:ABC-type antimicrobial peptide transport system permease subunit
VPQVRGSPPPLLIANSLAARRFVMTMLNVFAAVALLLASVGLYGVISYLVGQRTHEFGIRLALGAQPKDLFRIVLSQGLKMAMSGIAIGLVVALGLTRLMAKMLYGVSTTDPATFMVIASLLTAVAVLAGLVPAWRATKVDPLIALRHE